MHTANLVMTGATRAPFPRLDSTPARVPQSMPCASPRRGDSGSPPLPGRVFDAP